MEDLSLMTQVMFNGRNCGRHYIQISVVQMDYRGIQILLFSVYHPNFF